MAILDTALDPRAPSFLDKRSVALAALQQLEAAHARARDGGGEREVAQHHARGKLLPRERIELLVDRDSAVLELAASEGDPPGAGLVTSLGVIEQTLCMIVANDPTVGEGRLTDAGARKVTRAIELATAYRLIVVLLLDGCGPGGAISKQMPELTLCAAFGALDGWTADLAELADHTIGVRLQTAEAQTDLIAEDERDALRMLRRTVRGLPIPPPRRARKAPLPPRYEIDDLLGADPANQMREVLARILDGSDFDEFRPHRGDEVVTGFGSIHGMRVAVLAGTGSTMSAEAAQKGVELVRLAEAAAIPLLTLVNSVAEPNVLAAPLTRIMSTATIRRITIALGPNPDRWAVTGGGFRFGWVGREDAGWRHDGVIDPRDTRIVLGICLGVAS